MCLLVKRDGTRGTWLASALWVGVACLSLGSGFGCGGGAISDFDAFEPRAAASTDFAGRAFGFSWLPEGNPIDSGVGAMDVSFSEIDGGGRGTVTVSEHGAGSGFGRYLWDPPSLQVTFETTLGQIALEPGQVVEVLLEAEVSDGRIRLTDQGRGVGAASDPD